MFCPKCGTFNDENAKICTGCGKNLAENESAFSGASPSFEGTSYETPAYEKEQPARDYNDYNGGAYYNNADNASNNYNAYYSNPVVENIQPTVPEHDNNSKTVNLAENYVYNNSNASSGNNGGSMRKKGNKKMITAGVALAVVIILCSVVAFGKTAIERKVLGEMQFYLLREAKTMSEVVDLSSCGDFDFNSFNDNAELNIKYSEGGDLGFATKANIDISFDEGKEAGVLSIGNIEVSLPDYSGKTKSVTLDADLHAGIKDDCLVVASKYIDKQFVRDPSESEDEKRPDWDAVSEDLMKAVLASAKENFTKDLFTSSKKTVNGKSCTVVHFEADNKAVAKFLKGIVDKTEDNEKVQEALRYIIDMYVNFDSPYGSDDQKNEQIENIIKMIKEESIEALEDEDFKLEYDVTYNRSGFIVMRELTADDTTIIIETDANRKESSMDITIEDYDKTKISYTQSKADKGLNANIKVDYDNSEVNIAISNLEYKKCNGINVVTGKISAKGDDEFKFEITGSIDKKKYNINANYIDDDDEKFVLTLENNLSKKADLSKLPEIDKKNKSDNFAEVYEEYMDALSDEVDKKNFDVSSSDPGIYSGDYYDSDEYDEYDMSDYDDFELEL